MTWDRNFHPNDLTTQPKYLVRKQWQPTWVLLNSWRVELGLCQHSTQNRKTYAADESFSEGYLFYPGWSPPRRALEQALHRYSEWAPFMILRASLKARRHILLCPTSRSHSHCRQSYVFPQSLHLGNNCLYDGWPVWLFSGVRRRHPRPPFILTPFSSRWTTCSWHRICSIWDRHFLAHWLRPWCSFERAGMLKVWSKNMHCILLRSIHHWSHSPVTWCAPTSRCLPVGTILEWHWSGRR